MLKTILILTWSTDGLVWTPEQTGALTALCEKVPYILAY